MNIVSTHKNQPIKLKKARPLSSFARRIPTKTEMAIFLLLSSPSIFAYQTDIGTICDAGAIVCSSTTQNNALIDGTAGGASLEHTHVWNGGVIQNNTVQNGGSIYLHQNAIAYDTAVSENGLLQIADGAEARGFVEVYSKGTVYMHAGVTQGAYTDALFLTETDSTLALINTNSAKQNVTFEILSNNGKITFNHIGNDGYIVANVGYLSGSGLFEMRVGGQAGDFLNVTESTEGDFTVQVLTVADKLVPTAMIII